MDVNLRDSPFSKSFGANEAAIRGAFMTIQTALETRLGQSPTTIEQTADKPVYFGVARLDNPMYLEEAAGFRREIGRFDSSSRDYAFASRTDAPIGVGILSTTTTI